MLNGERSILIVVPRGGQDACRSLSHTFADDSTVEVIVDRRLTDRRSGNGAHRPERRQGDRRTRPDADAELKVDRATGAPLTAHTTSPVPFIVAGASAVRGLRDGGKLGDVAPTLLPLVGLEVPREMSGDDLRAPTPPSPARTD